MDGLHKIPRGHRFHTEMTSKMMNCWILMSSISAVRTFEGYAKGLVVVEINERLVKE
ncbi:hypothetical protein CsSME_00016278 [Camellia sinensis var. sinensis]